MVAVLKLDDLALELAVRMAAVVPELCVVCWTVGCLCVTANVDYLSQLLPGYFFEYHFHPSYYARTFLQFGPILRACTLFCSLQICAGHSAIAGVCLFFE